MQKLTRKSQGFTIIEVLIVLAIAALIMLIVFLAVPALQRNSRNNARRNDASRLASAVTDYQANNNGDMPTSAAQVLDLAGTLAQYENSNVSIGTGNQSAIASENSIRVVTGAECGTNGATSSASRRAAVQFAVETASSPDPTCLDV